MLTIFEDVKAQTAHPWERTFEELADYLLNPQEYPAKTDCPLMSGVSYGDQRTIKGSLRSDDNAVSISWVIVDYDGGKVDVASAQAILSWAGIKAIIYTSASHIKEHPRWRIMAPLSADYPPSAYREFVGRVNAALGGILARESFTLSQSYYFGRVTGAAYECVVSEGQCVDLVQIEPQYPVPAAAKPFQVISNVVTDETIEELRSALAVIPSDERPVWIEVGQALRPLGDTGRELWEEWSAKSDKYNPERDGRTWEGLSGDRTGYPSIFVKAQRLGWINPRKSVQVDLIKAFSNGAASDLHPLNPYNHDVRDGTYSTRPLSELGNAERLLDAHGGNIHFVHDAKAWLHWHGGAWVWDVDGAAMRGLATLLPQQIYNEGGLHLADAEYFAKWSRTSQKERTVLATVSLLQDFDRVRLSLSSVDADLFKVGFDYAKQVLDLRTGRARPARQDDLVTKSLSVDRIGEASKAVRWQDFLTQIFGNDAELIDWVKRWCGYMLTGSTAEQIFIFCFGLGANGKSVLGDILRYILCDYARAIASETLTESKRAAGSATPDLAELVGARMAMSAETEDGAALAESLIKSLVSGDTMTVRKLYTAPVQFTPQFKLMMLGNHKPIIKGNDHGIWRRVRLIPFRRTFKPEERDAALSGKLKAEAPHILAWMVEGCIDWQQRGLKDTPVTIQQATDSYQEEQDLIGSWLSECCKLSPSSEASSTEIYANYKSWCMDNGLRPASSVGLSRRLSERGFCSRKSNGARLWAGLSVGNLGYSDNYRTASGR